MAINPITVTRIKTVSLMGHSNGDGWGSTQRLFENYTYLRPGTATPEEEPLKAYWKNIYVATSALPYPGDHGTPTASDVGTVDWLEMTVANTAEPDDPHPHASPYQYPNNQGACYSNYVFNAYDGGSVPVPSVTPADPSSTTLGVRHGVEIPLMWAWRGFWQEQVGLVKMAFSSSLFSAQEIGPDPAVWIDGLNVGGLSPTESGYTRSAVDPTEGFHAWWTPEEHFDWAPQTDRLYKKWFDRMVGAQAALPVDSDGVQAKLDVQMVLPWFGDNDSLTRGEEGLRESFKRNWESLIKRVRKDLVANDWTTLNEREIPIIIPKVHYAYVHATDTPGFSSPVFCNEVLDEIAKQDPFVRIVNSWAWETIETEGYSLVGIAAGSHFGSNGYVDAAKEIMAAWEDCREEAYDALRDEETITVGEAIDKARIYYSKSRTNTDMDRELTLQHMNGALNHVINHVGDNCWWLTRRKQLSISSGSTTVMTLPTYVHRLLKIEDGQDPQYPIMFEQISHGDGGKLQINVSERGSGTYWCHYITHPKELTRDDQVLPAPRNITEWIIVETCRRMAAASSNAPLMAFFGGEALQLQSDSLRNMGQVQRSKRDAMRTQRSRPNFRYGGRGRSRWAQDW